MVRLIRSRKTFWGDGSGEKANKILEWLIPGDKLSSKVQTRFSLSLIKEDEENLANVTMHAGQGDWCDLIYAAVIMVSFLCQSRKRK
jgi:hypothetical protein